MDIIMDIFEKTAIALGVQVSLVFLAMLILLSIIFSKLKLRARGYIDCHKDVGCRNIASKLLEFFVAIPFILFSLYASDVFSVFKPLPNIGDILYTICQLSMILICVAAMEVISKILKSELSSSDRSQARLAASIHVLVLLIFSKNIIPLNTIVGYLLILFGRFIFYDTVFDANNITEAVKEVVRQIPFLLSHLCIQFIYCFSCGCR